MAGNYHKQDVNQTPPTSTHYFWLDQIAVIAKDFLGIVPSGPGIKKEKWKKNSDYNWRSIYAKTENGLIFLLSLEDKVKKKMEQWDKGNSFRLSFS